MEWDEDSRQNGEKNIKNHSEKNIKRCFHRGPCPFAAHSVRSSAGHTVMVSIQTFLATVPLNYRAFARPDSGLSH